MLIMSNKNSTQCNTYGIWVIWHIQCIIEFRDMYMYKYIHKNHKSQVIIGTKGTGWGVSMAPEMNKRKTPAASASSKCSATVETLWRNTDGIDIHCLACPVLSVVNTIEPFCCIPITYFEHPPPPPPLFHIIVPRKRLFQGVKLCSDFQL